MEYVSSHSNLFTKGDYRPIPADFRVAGVQALAALTDFQKAFEMFDTDTTVNTIRDAMVGQYLGFDLINFNKHGFDAKADVTEQTGSEQFLEIKQCSISSSTLGGVWNDTSEEKAVAFCDSRVFTVVAVWKGASDLQFMVFGRNPALGKEILRRVQTRKPGARSTQNIPIQKLIKDFGFRVVCPPDRTQGDVARDVCLYMTGLVSQPKDVLTIDQAIALRNKK